MCISVHEVFNDWLEREKKKFNQAVNASNQIVEMEKEAKINGGDIACSQGEGRHIHTNCNSSLCKRFLFQHVK